MITIAHFSKMMLQKNADHAGIAPLFDELLSTEVGGVYKPDPKAYELTERLGLEADATSSDMAGLLEFVGVPH